MIPLVLASASPTRRRLLDNAGLRCEVLAPELDERAAELPLKEAGAPPDDIAAVLAEAKAAAVSAARPGSLVIGADQTLDLDGGSLSKPASMEEARRQILALAGRRHSLHAAVACVRDGETLWRHVETVHLTMRPLTPAEVGRYMAEAGPVVLGSVGAYQVEGVGIRLFERIDGDFFAILGLPMLPLLAFLRQAGALEE
jgi:septum formation protein